MTTKDTIKILYLKKLINSKGYTTSRADTMNDRVQYWREAQSHATTNKCRQFCGEMVDMYVKRYMFYVKR